MNFEAFWESEFGTAEEARDYAGRKILRSRFGRYDDRYGWAVERISRDGGAFGSNLHAVSVAAEAARYGRGTFRFEGGLYTVGKAPNTSVPYDYSRKDFCILRLDGADDFWKREFGDVADAVDFTGRRIARDLYGSAEEGGWNLDHILPLARGGADAFENLQAATLAANSAKADKLRFTFGGAVYRVLKSTDATETQWKSTPYDYLKKDYCVVREIRNGD